MRAPSPLSLVVAITVVMLAADCHVGPDVSDYPPASSPYGVIGSFVVENDSFDAELLAVRDSSFVLLRDQKVVELPFAGISSATFAHLDMHLDIRMRSNARLRPGELAQLRILSHFPQGLSAELERKLLEAYGQTAPTVLGK